MKQESNGKKNRFPLRARFRYWFDNRMAKGSLGFIHILIIASLIFAILIAGLVVALGLSDDGEPASILWNSVATLINAWMPYFEDGGPGYIALMSFTAIAGVLFTSVLIGIVTSAIEEKIIDLKKGNSPVLEQGHTVILGFQSGEFTLLEQLILAAAGKPACVVIADDVERDEMEQAVRDNLDVPQNFRVICRTADINDPVSLEMCSIETCKTVIISPMDDIKTIKALLAVSVLLHEKGCADVKVNAVVSRSEFRFPSSLAQRHNITALQTDETLAKIIAHSCTQKGLSSTFREVFNFEGSEFYTVDIPGIGDMTFGELTVRLDRAVAIGVFRDGQVRLTPPKDYRLAASDRLLVFSEEPDSIQLLPAAEAGKGASDSAPPVPRAAAETGAVILGYNGSLPTILREMPENVSHVILASNREIRYDRETIEKTASARSMAVSYCDKLCSTENALLELVRSAEHIIILNDHEKTEDEADMEASFLLITLRDLRERFDLHFNITTEMRREQNQNLLIDEDHTDFVVASSMSSLILAQLAENPELKEVFRELLSNEGSELYLKNVGKTFRPGTYSVERLRGTLLDAGYVFLGFVNAEFESTFNPPLRAELTLTESDSLIVLGEQ